MKPSKNLPVYLLSFSLLFVGVTSASQAQAAWTTSEKAKVTALTNRISQLESQINELATANEDATNSLNAYEDSNIRFIAIQGSLTSCPMGSRKFDLYSSSFNAGGKTLVECTMTVLTKR